MPCELNVASLTIHYFKLISNTVGVTLIGSSSLQIYATAAPGCRKVGLIMFYPTRGILPGALGACSKALRILIGRNTRNELAGVREPYKASLSSTIRGRVARSWQ
jgi:hypothetical protein